jgi:hypothetical protein
MHQQKAKQKPARQQKAEQLYSQSGCGDPKTFEVVWGTKKHFQEGRDDYYLITLVEGNVKGKETSR